MEGVAKMKKKQGGLDNALENKDTLFLIFSFLDPRDIGACARVNKAFHRAAQTELLWEKVCQRAAYPRVHRETWKASFELSHPRCRDWHIEQMRRLCARLGSVPLQALREQGLPAYLRSRKGGPYSDCLDPLHQSVATLTAVFRTAHDAPDWFLKEFDVRITLATGMQPSSKDTRRAEARFVLNGTHSLVHYAGMHDQFSCPKILFCEKLAGGTRMRDSDQGSVLGWLGQRARGEIFPLVFNEFDSQTVVVVENVVALLRELGAPPSVKPLRFLKALVMVGMPGVWYEIEPD
jgi:hypothetical protein